MRFPSLKIEPLSAKLAWLMGFFTVLLISINSVQAASPTIHVAKTAGCGCCKVWVSHLRDAGFTVKTRDISYAKLNQFKRSLGIGPELSACHTATVADYFIEGHVPARELTRLLNTKPRAKGLAVPGMPAGSPGMDFGTRKERYDVLLIHADKTPSVFASYP